MKQGKVKFFNSEKGFGFITEDGTGKEVFVHKSNLNGTVREGDSVTFEIEEGQKGPSAVRVSQA